MFLWTENSIINVLWGKDDIHSREWNVPCYTFLFPKPKLLIQILYSMGIFTSCYIPTVISLYFYKMHCNVCEACNVEQLKSIYPITITFCTQFIGWMCHKYLFMYALETDCLIMSRLTYKHFCTIMFFKTKIYTV